MKVYKITGVNYSDINLNRTTIIECSDGIKRPVDSFYVCELSSTGNSAEVMFRNGKIKTTLNKKRIKYENGKMYIKVGNSLYTIGEYEEV